MSHPDDLATRVRPGERFVLTAGDSPDVMFRGTMLDDGGAELDVLSHRGVAPVRVSADELAQIFDPTIHKVSTIGTAV